DTARREPQVLLDRQAVHHRRHLRLDPDAEAHDLVGAPAGHVLAADEDAAVAVVEANLPGQALEEGALAGTVGTDEAAQLAVGEREIDVVDRLDAAEAHRQIAGIDDRFAHGPSPRWPRRRRVLLACLRLTP